MAFYRGTQSAQHQKVKGYGKMAVTTKDIAAACGISRTTVTRALSGNGSVKPETKERILAKAEEMGYAPDLIARSLVNG